MPRADDREDRLPVFVLTCRIAPPERRVSALAQLAPLADVVRVIFIDGFVDTEDRTRALRDVQRERRWTRRPLTLREVACYGTHRSGWEALLATGHPFAIMLEDDFLFTDVAALRRLIANVGQIMAGDVDLLKLFDFNPGQRERTGLRRHTAGESLLFPKHPAVGTVGYVLTTRGAERLLQRRSVFRAIDEDLRYYWEFGLRVWTLERPLVAEASVTLGGSLLESGRTIARTKRNLRQKLHGMLLSAHRRVRNVLCFASARRALRNVTLGQR